MPQPQRVRRQGFTLVELLVVIAIIGTLVGLLLPAVQTARESARLSACSNNIRQVSLGVLGFESARGRFPAAWGDPVAYQLMSGSSSWNRHSFISLVLPYMEEDALYNSIVSYIKVAGPSNAVPWATATYGGMSSPYLRQPLSLVCPSEVTRTVPTSVNSGRGITSYHCNRGDIWTDAPNNPADAPSLRRGPFANGSPFSPNQGAVVKAMHMTDGVSKTIMLGEVILGDGSVKYGPGSGVKTGLTTASAPSQCSDVLSGSGYSTSVPVTNGQLVGYRWGDANNTYTGFYTAVAPNYPRCSAGGSYPGEQLLCPPASSYHSGGANVAMCDGSIRFIANSIDAGDPTVGQSNPGTYSGPSIRGVWGALGTMAAGETNTNID